MEREDQAPQKSYITEFPTIFVGIKPEELGEYAHYTGTIGAVTQIYAIMDGPDPQRGRLYPADANEKELEEANQKDPKILDRTTVVRRDEKGNLVATPYSQEYKELLGILSTNLGYLGETLRAPEDASYYQKLSQAIAKGDYEEAKRIAIEMDPKIKIEIGLDRYRDQLMGAKDVFWAFMGMKDDEKSEIAQRLANDLTTAYGTGPVKVRVDDTLFLAGALSEGKPSFKIETDPKTGSMITIFSPVRRERSGTHTSILDKIYPESVHHSKEELETLSTTVMLGHELAHPYFNRTHERHSLGGKFAAISELYCDLFGIINTQKLKGKSVSEETWKLLIPHVVASCVQKYQQLKDNKMMRAYFEGAVILFNNLLEKGVINFEGKELKFDEEEFLKAGKDILNEVDEIKSEQEATAYVQRYLNTDAIEEYSRTQAA